MTDELRDALLDWAAENVNCKTRDRAMERAHAAGLTACELCGRAVKDPADPDFAVGPECIRKLRKAGIM